MFWRTNPLQKYPCWVYCCPMKRQHEIGNRYWELKKLGMRAKPLYEQLRKEFGPGISDSTIRAYGAQAKKWREPQLFADIFDEPVKVEAQIGASLYLKALKEAQARGLSMDDLISRLLHQFCLDASIIEASETQPKG